jgi:enoyl-CoA hydratase/carnithine racemase
LEEGMAAEERQFEASFWTDDAREGVAAFLEKRSADFKGR